MGRNLDGNATETPSIAMSNGFEFSSLLFGTWKVGYVPSSSTEGRPAERTAEEVVTDALAAGYRAFDCASFYQNQKGIGRALAASGVPRDKLLLVSKVWTSDVFKGPQAVLDSVAKMLADLQVSYLDVVMLHWPVPGYHVAAYKALEELHAAGVIRTLGLSNYTIEDYEELEKECTTKPCVWQAAVSPWLYRKKTVNYFRDKGMVVQSYRTINQGKAGEEPCVAEIAARLGKTPSQIAGRWCVQHGYAYTAKSEKLERMLENADVFSFELTHEDMEKMDGLMQGSAREGWRNNYDTCIVRETGIAIESVRGRKVTAD